MRMVWVFLLIFAQAAGAAWADSVRVEEAAGHVVVQADALKLAAWRVGEEALAVVTAGGEVRVGRLPDGVKVREIGENGLKGVLVEGVKGPWEVVKDGRNWLLREGSTPVVAQSALLLRDGWRVGEELVKPRRMVIDDVAWDVGMLTRAVSVGGSVVGAVRRADGGGPVAQTAAAPVEQVKKPEPVRAAKEAEHEAATVEAEAAPVAETVTAALASNTLQPVSLSAMLARGTAGKADDDAEKGLPDAPSGLLVRDAAQAAEDGPKLSLTRAEPLRPLAYPRTSSELLPMDLSDIYIPGTLVSLTLPEGLRLPALPVAPAPDATPAASVPEAVEKTAAAKPVEKAEEPVAKAVPTTPVVETAPVAEAGAALEGDDDIRLAALIPARDGDYMEGLVQGWQAIAETSPDSERERAARLRLAGFYLAWQRPEEALRVLAVLPTRRSDGLAAQPLARLYQGLAQLARGKVPPAGSFDQRGRLAQHAQLWRAVSAAQREDYGAALKAWPKERGLLPEYPGYLRQLAQLAQATALVEVGDRQVATRAVDALVEAYTDGTAPAALVRLQGLVRLGTKDEARGLELLAQASESKSDPATAYRAKYEFVRALQRRHELSDEQVITYLNDLRYDWRGDALERDVLRTLAALYEENGDAREALRTWQVLVNAFPNLPDLDGLTTHMTNAFVRVFDPENPKTYDALTYLGLYYDFRELVPNSPQGDAAQEQVGRLLSDVTLYERALPVLQQQLNYRPLDPASQGRLALMIAADHRELGDAAESLKVLDKWHKVATTTALARGWKVEEARALLALKRPQAAKKAVAGLPVADAEVRDIRIAADWRAQNWQGAIPNLLSKLRHVSDDELARSTDAQLALFQLAYAYGQLEDAGKLDALTRQYASVLGQVPQLADDLGAVAAGTGLSATVVVAGPLAPLTTAMVDLNRLTEKMRKVRADLKHDHERQQEYNDKMKYMELLPPPVL